MSLRCSQHEYHLGGSSSNRLNIYPWAVGKIADGVTLGSREQVDSITESIWEVTGLEG